jgi:hypothetical protein
MIAETIAEHKFYYIMPGGSGIEGSGAHRRNEDIDKNFCDPCSSGLFECVQ